MTITTKEMLIQYMMGTDGNSDDDNDTLLKIKQMADPITFQMKRVWKTSGFISLLDSKETLFLFLNQFTVLFSQFKWAVICSTFSAAKILYEISVTIEQPFRTDEIIENILRFLITNDFEQWIEKSGGWESMYVSE